MKKFLSLLTAVLMLVGCLAACSAPGAGDVAYVKEKGTLVVGITVFEPMDYQDADGNWIGFDAEMAALFAEKLGVKAEFQIIEWDNKAFELEGKTIDVVWNGMTLTDEVKAAMACSNAYCNNQQIVIVKKDVADQYKTVDSVKGLKFAVEAGSAGKKQVEALGAQFVEVADQATALSEVKAGTSDAAVIDSLMAGAMVGEGTGYADLMYTVGLNDEEYGVGFRKGSDLVAELNKFFKETYADGTMMELAEKYGVQASIIEQK
ncbi:MAG: transporter substrate-binding domain-containing protein [Clostridia bacterium]|nr:transporter substrate-binding domain-containing protein [Clostridia bacterium]